MSGGSDALCFAGHPRVALTNFWEKSCILFGAGPVAKMKQ